MNGASFRVNVPEIPETDTKLSTDYDAAVLNYAAERHTDRISGNMLGQLINVDDLRDVDIDDNLDGHCYELVYRKWQSCGDGCQSLKNRWTNFNINSEGAKQNGIQFVRGANSYGCPVYLDIPTDRSTYWWGMWRPVETGVGTEFGYIQPEDIDSLPKADDGSYLVLTQDPTTKRPQLGKLNLDCILNNIMQNFGFGIEGTFSKVQENVNQGFSASFNAHTGRFQITWHDWNAANNLAGVGKLNGQVFFDYSFSGGDMTCTLSRVRFYNATWTVHNAPTGSKPSVQIDFVDPSGNRTTVLDKDNYGDADWEVNIQRSYDYNRTFTLGPTESSGPLQFCYIFVDWVSDDEGYFRADFKNNLLGWNEC